MALQNLRAEMARAGITQKELSDKVGVSERTINSWFSGEAVPRIDVAFDVRDSYFDYCNIDYLFAMDGTSDSDRD